MVWICVACTFENTNDVFLSCECCATARNDRKISPGTPVSSKKRNFSYHDGNSSDKKKKRSLVDVLRPQGASSFSGLPRLCRPGKQELILQDSDVPKHVPCEVIRDVLPRETADRCMILLKRDALSWESHPWYIYGKWGRTPRTTKSFRLSASPETTNGTGTVNEVENNCPSSNPELLKILDDIAAHLASVVSDSRPGRQPPFFPTLALANRYADHTENAGAHSDFLGELGPRPIIVGLSLGACRDFVISSKPMQPSPKQNTSSSDSVSVHIPMSHNSVVIMWGECQERWNHSVPACSEKAIQRHSIVGAERYSLTFRMSRSGQFKRPRCRCGHLAELKFRGASYRWICAANRRKDKGKTLQAPCNFDEVSEWAWKEAVKLAAGESQISNASFSTTPCSAVQGPPDHEK